MSNRASRFLQNYWYIAALASELRDKPLARTICGLPLVLFRGESGAVAALEDRCPHRQAPLSMGLVVGDDIQCNYHGLVFDRSGACVHVPRQDRIPAGSGIRAFAAIERWGYVWIWWGDPSRADPEAIPALTWTEQPGSKVAYLRFYVKAHAQLMADNLLDVSHVDFLHKTTIASKVEPKSRAAEAPKVTMETRVEGDSAITVRTVHDTLIAGMTAGWVGTEGPVTRISTGRWLPPFNCLLKLEFIDPGGANLCTIKLDHIMTPETERSSHYFLDWNWDFDRDGYPDHADVDREQRILIEGDDIPMVEAQQRNIDAFGAPRDVPVSQDRMVSAVHRILARLYAQQGIDLSAASIRSPLGPGDIAA